MAAYPHPQSSTSEHTPHMPTTSRRDHPTVRLGQSDRFLHFLLRMPWTAPHLLVLYQRLTAVIARMPPSTTSKHTIRRNNEEPPVVLCRPPTWAGHSNHYRRALVRRLG